MIENLIPLIGKRIDSEEVKAAFVAWKVPFPKKITCTANNSSLGNCKFKKDGLSIEFGKGGNGKLLKPVPGGKKNYIALAIFINADKNYKGNFPFELQYSMNEAEFTQILGQPKETSFMNIVTKVWRKEYKIDYEVLVTIDMIEGKPEKQMRLQCKWDAALELLQDYEKAGL